MVCPPGDHVNLSKALRRLIFDATLRRDDGGSRVAGRPGPAELADAGGNVRAGPGRVTERFDADWLTLREPFDHAARSVALARRLADRLPGGRACSISAPEPAVCSASWRRSSAAGRTGSWSTADAALLDEAFGRTAAWARRQGFAATAPGDALLVSTPHGLWRMQAVQRDLTSSSSWPGLAPPSTSSPGAVKQGVDGRAKPGHDDGEPSQCGCSGVQRAARSGFRRVARSAVRHAACPVPRLPDGGRTRCLAARSSQRRARAFGVPARPAARQGLWTGTRHRRAVRRAAGTCRARLRDGVGCDRLARAARRPAACSAR